MPKRFLRKKELSWFCFSHGQEVLVRRWEATIWRVSMFLIDMCLSCWKSCCYHLPLCSQNISLNAFHGCPHWHKSIEFSFPNSHLLFSIGWLFFTSFCLTSSSDWTDFCENKEFFLHFGFMGVTLLTSQQYRTFLYCAPTSLPTDELGPGNGLGVVLKLRSFEGLFVDNSLHLNNNSGKRFRRSSLENEVS